MNVFTKRVKRATAASPPRRRGRPRGATEQSAATREQLYQAAIKLIAAKGYEATTLRDIAKKAGVSVGLLYRYFPSKRAVVLALYDELSAEYAARAEKMPPGPWHARFLFALKTSLAVLAPHRSTLAGLTAVLIGDPYEGVLAPGASQSRVRVQPVFVEAVTGATDAPDVDAAAALGRLLYVAHLASVLWWLLDRSPRQRATERALAMLERMLPLAANMLQLAPAQAMIRTADSLFREALFGNYPSHAEEA